MSKLVVWRDDAQVGVLDTAPNGDVRFTYDVDVATEGHPGHAIGMRCPVRARASHQA